MNNKLSLPIHTVIFLIGPEKSGKSEWASILQNKIKSIDDRFRCPIISLQDNESLDDFKAKVKELMNFPNAHEFIIIDALGHNEFFRAELTELSQKKAYQVGAIVFDYKKDEYLKYFDESEHHNMARVMNEFKRNVIPSISRKNFDYLFNVKGKWNHFFENLDLSIPNHSLWKSCKIDSSRGVAFIGDIHEHVDALEALRSQIPEGTQIILVGDYLDKGQQTAKIIPVIEDMVSQGAKVVVGNHESYVARRLKGEIKETDKEAELFTSLACLQNDKELADRFLAIYEKSVPFVFYEGDKMSAYATHAPCRNRFLGKVNSEAQKSQRNFFFKSRENVEDMAKELEFLSYEANDNHPLHIFGHVAHQFEVLEHKNKVWLDTGAVYGNKLTALLIDEEGNKQYIHVPTIQLAEGDFFKFPESQENESTIKMKKRI